MVIKKFPITKIEKELLEINEKHQIKTNVAVQIIINNIKIYNTLLDLFNKGEFSKLYLMYQLSGTIFKHLKEYNIFPSSFKSVDNSEDDEYEFDKFQKNISKKK